MAKRGTRTCAHPARAEVERRLPGWSRLLDQWEGIVAHNAWKGTSDCAWWYGERASVSQLAGAAWKLRPSWAIQEYAGTRGAESQHGRIDLAMEAGPLRSVVEAKQIWPRLGSEGVREDVEYALAAARVQLVEGRRSRIAHHDEYDHVAVAFVAPRGRARDAEQAAHIDAALAAVRRVRGAVIRAVFPSWAAGLTSELNGLVVCPGVILVAQPVRARARRRAGQ